MRMLSPLHRAFDRLPEPTRFLAFVAVVLMPIAILQVVCLPAAAALVFLFGVSRLAWLTRGGKA